jgi:hypothetical protein
MNHTIETQVSDILKEIFNEDIFDLRMKNNSAIIQDYLVSFFKSRNKVPCISESKNLITQMYQMGKRNIDIN